MNFIDQIIYKSVRQGIDVYSEKICMLSNVIVKKRRSAWYLGAAPF